MKGRPTKRARTSSPLSASLSKVYISLDKILSTDDCRQIILAAELYATENGGWSTQRHIAYPTKDLSVESLPSLLQWLPTKIKQHLLPAFEKLYSLKANSLFIEDMFIAKYEFDETKCGQRGLGEHEDGSPWSFVVPLNERTEFDGGGTKFVYLNHGEQLYRPTQGKCVFFSGKNRHCGVPITRGVRYILAGFCGDDSDFAPPDEDVDDMSTLLEEEELEENDACDDDDATHLSIVKELANEAEMDLESLLPPGYLAQRNGTSSLALHTSTLNTAQVLEANRE